MKVNWFAVKIITIGILIMALFGYFLVGSIVNTEKGYEKEEYDELKDKGYDVKIIKENRFSDRCLADIDGMIVNCDVEIERLRLREKFVNDMEDGQ